MTSKNSKDDDSESWQKGYERLWEQVQQETDSPLNELTKSLLRAVNQSAQFNTRFAEQSGLFDSATRQRLQDWLQQQNTKAHTDYSDLPHAGLFIGLLQHFEDLLKQQEFASELHGGIDQQVLNEWLSLGGCGGDKLFAALSRFFTALKTRQLSYLQMQLQAVHSLHESTQQGDQQPSVRAWVEALESSYQEWVKTAEFAASFAELLNSSNQLRREFRELLESWIEELGLIRSDELKILKSDNENLNCQVQELRAELQELRREWRNAQ